MSLRRRPAVVALALATVLTATLAAQPAAANTEKQTQHVILLSVDGLHQADLTWYLRHHPNSSLASLVSHGVQFTQALAPVPSDSFPGLLGPVTGGHPRSTGVYYDVSYNHALLPAGTTSCDGVKPGATISYNEDLDRDGHALDAGQGLGGLPDSILRMTGNPATLIKPANLPVDPAGCQPVFPHQYLKVNTVFEVVRTAGQRTAWSDKHPAYEILNGPSGGGVQDLFTPEINSDAPTKGSSIDWTKMNSLTRRYDSYKVKAVLNEINGYDHGGTVRLGTPAIFGMNFSVFTGGKGKIAEHGGAHENDRAVALIVSGQHVGEHGTSNSRVETTQIAPTILSLLGLRPSALQAVGLEHTAVLPLDGHDDGHDGGNV